LFIVFALRLRREQTASAAMALFRYSITYLSLLFVAMAGDVLIRFH
jgi:heme O synthase-like polyprenyltransferase